MDQGDWLAERFQEHRARLRAVAYRMLGWPSEADGGVQEAWVRAAAQRGDPGPGGGGRGVRRVSGGSTGSPHRRQAAEGEHHDQRAFMEEQGRYHAARYLLGLSNANRQAAGVVTGDEVEVDVEFGAEPPVVAEPADFARALDADPVARTAYDHLAYSHQRQHMRAIENAKKPETRARRIDKAVAMLRDQESAGGTSARARTQPRAR